MATNTFYSSAKAQKPPPPPPRQAKSGTTTATTKASRQRQSKSIRTGVGVPEGEGRANLNSSPKKPSENNPYSQPHSMRSGTGTASRQSTPSSRKAPIASRPVGSYYNTSKTTTAGTNFSHNNGSSSDNNNNWDDWSATDNSTAVTPTPPAPDNHSSWAPSSSSPASQSSGFTNNHPSQLQNNQSMEPGNVFYQSQQQQQQPFLSGAMDSSAPTMMEMNTNSNKDGSNGEAGLNPFSSSFSMFTPSLVNQEQQQLQDENTYPSFENEAPLLEELGINIEHILLKTKAVVLPFTRFGGDKIDPSVICKDGDIIGPVFLLLLLGGEMVLAGKLQFGFIYIYALFGTMLMTLVVNLISPNDPVSFFTVFSIMGYSILPVNVLALVKIFIMNLIHLETLGNILGGLTIFWSTVASTRLLEQGCGLYSQRYLIFYPLFLFFSAFVMMTIF